MVGKRAVSEVSDDVMRANGLARELMERIVDKRPVRHRLRPTAGAVRATAGAESDALVPGDLRS